MGGLLKVRFVSGLHWRTCRLQQRRTFKYKREYHVDDVRSIRQQRPGKERLALGGASCLEGEPELPTPKGRSRSILIVDGTNVLSRSYGSFKSVFSHETFYGGTVKVKDVFAMWIEYLAYFVQADVVLCIFDHPRNVNMGVGNHKKRKGKIHLDQNGSKERKTSLFEYRGYFDGKTPSWRMALSIPGEEADRSIMRVVHYLNTHYESMKTLGERTRVFVASGDRDMQGVINDSVSWMEILPFPTKHAPSGLAFHGLDDFKWKDYFHPSQYGTFLTLVGKGSSSKSGGVGIGEKTAAKLVRLYGSIDSMYRAFDAGQMKSWDVKIQKVFERSSDSPHRKKLQRNRKIFEFCPCKAGTLQEDSMYKEYKWIQSALKKEAIEKDACTSNNKSIHPFFSLRWMFVEAVVRHCLQPLESSCLISWMPSLGDDRYADACIQNENDTSCEKLYILFIMVDSLHFPDVDAQGYADIAYSTLMDLKNTSGGGQGLLDPYNIRKENKNSMARYLKILKDCDYNVLLLPFSSKKLIPL